MPLANGFVLPDEFSSEYFYDLRVGFCSGCMMVQLTEVVEPERIFHDRYPFYSSSSAGMVKHFRKFAGEVLESIQEKVNPFVVEIGSNDGTLLRHFADAEVRHLGIDPSTNVVQVAINREIDTLCRFFNEDTARQVVADHGQADVILAANVLRHMADLNSKVLGIKSLLNPGGRLIFEEPYLGDIIDMASYDQIYDEHVFYFSVISVCNLFKRHGMEVIDIRHQNVHGGTMRFTVAHENVYQPSWVVRLQRRYEKITGLHELETYETFSFRTELSLARLEELLRDLKKKGNRVIGYGASAKSTIVINSCGITSDVIEFIADTTPEKQGKCSPGNHIPVRPREAFTSDYPDYALLFIWNHCEEVLKKERDFKAAGGKWIVYVPEVRIL